MRLLMQRATLSLIVATTAACTPMTATSDTPSLEGTSWVLSSLPGHDLGSSPPATLRFEGANASGSDGCNRYSLGFTADGARLQWTTPGISTQMACPPDVTKRAQAYMDALRGSTSFRVMDGRLELLGGDGKPRATLVAQSTQLPGTAWRATGINNGRNAVVSLVAGSEVTMIFGADGRVSGTAGCNNYSAGFEADGSRLKFTPAAATRKMCASEDVMQQEQAFLTALGTVATVQFEGDRLDLRSTDGALAITLTRDATE